MWVLKFVLLQVVVYGKYLIYFPVYTEHKSILQKFSIPLETVVVWLCRKNILFVMKLVLSFFESRPYNGHVEVSDCFEAL